MFVVLCLAMIRGSAYIATKNIIDVYSPFEIIFFRFLITGIALACFFWKKLSKLKKKEVFFGFLAGISLFAAFAFQTYGLKFTTVAKQSFLTSLYIVQIPFIQLLFFRKKFQKIVYFSLSVILIGLFFISFQNFKNLEFALNFGDFLTLLCAVAFAVNIVLFACIDSKRWEILNITIIQMLSVGGLGFVFQLFFEKRAISFQFHYSLLYLILICTLINFTLQNFSQKYVPAHKIGLILSLESVFGTIFAIIFLGEVVSINFMIGVLFILAGMFSVQIFEKESNKSWEEKDGEIRRKTY